MRAPSLDELLEPLCNGDARAAEQVFLAFEPYLRKVVRRQLPDRLRARFDSTDIVQSVWRDLLDGFRKAGWRFANTTQLQAFLVKVTRNRFIDRYRQHSPTCGNACWSCVLRSTASCSVSGAPVCPCRKSPRAQACMSAASAAFFATWRCVSHASSRLDVANGTAQAHTRIQCLAAYSAEPRMPTATDCTLPRPVSS